MQSEMVKVEQGTVKPEGACLSRKGAPRKSIEEKCPDIADKDNDAQTTADGLQSENCGMGTKARRAEALTQAGEGTVGPCDERRSVLVGVDIQEQRLAACLTVVEKYKVQATLVLADGATWRPGSVPPYVRRRLRKRPKLVEQAMEQAEGPELFDRVRQEGMGLIRPGFVDM